MSLRALYRKIPRDKRTCSYYRCQNPILRNIDRDDKGHIYHHGCLSAARDERYRCLECFMIFDATEAGVESHQVMQGDYMAERLRVICPSCGSRNLKAMRGG